MQLKRIMTDDISAVSPETSVRDVAVLMRDLNVGAVPICEGDQPLGMVTDRDITIRSTADGNIDNPVSEIMSQDLVYATTKTSDEEALDLMSQNQVRRLPIIEDGKMKGIVSFGDLAQNGQPDLELAEAISSISYPSKPDK